MKALVVGLCGLLLVVVGSGCDNACKNPLIIEQPDWKTGFLAKGPAIQCNIVTVCDRGQQGIRRTPWSSQFDPKVVDHGRENTDRCRQAASLLRPMDKYDTKDCHYEATPTPICLPASSTSPNAPDYTGPTGGSLITVGVGSGDYFFNADGTAGGGGLSEGAAGGGGVGGDGGEGGQGGI